MSTFLRHLVRLTTTLCVGFSPLWNNNIYVKCVLHTSLSQYTSCSVMWWRMRRGVNMLTANELAAAVPSSLSLISLFRFQPSTPFRVYLLSTKIDSTDRCVPVPPSPSLAKAFLLCICHTLDLLLFLLASNGPEPRANLNENHHTNLVWNNKLFSLVSLWQTWGDSATTRRISTPAAALRERPLTCNTPSFSPDSL